MTDMTAEQLRRRFERIADKLDKLPTSNDKAERALDDLATEVRLLAASLSGMSAVPEATPDEVIELAQALEQQRALKIVEAVQRLATGFEATYARAFAQACEEITHRLRTEVWELCARPIDAPAAPEPPHV